MPMTLTEETLQFIREHRKDNVRNLALQAHKYPTVDVPAAIIQIVGRQIAEEKYPLGQHGRYSLPDTSFHGTMLLGSNGKL